MLINLQRKTILLLRQPAGIGILTWIVSTCVLALQPQPWPPFMRVMLALLPAMVPALFALVVARFRERLQTGIVRLLLVTATLISWVALSLDIGQSFLPWVLVFLSSLFVSFLIAVRYTAILATGMIFFAVLYTGMRLHQGEQLLYLNMLVRIEQNRNEIQFHIDEQQGSIRLYEENAREPVLAAIAPEGFKRLAEPESDGFFGLSPAFVLSIDPDDTRAIPLIAVLLVPEDFPAELWNIQVNSNLEQLSRQGRIGRSEQKERKARCGNLDCLETFWVYEDRFHARLVQTGYGLVRIPTAGPAQGSRTFMIWFREPVIEGFPHHPIILEFLKGLSIGAATKAN